MAVGEIAWRLYFLESPNPLYGDAIREVHVTSRLNI
jgi:hypothetical protein